MIELVGDELYQWDVGRKVKITPKRGYTISCVHFNDGSDDSLTMVNGIATARIPDELLQQCGSVTVYAVSTKEGGIETTESRQFYIKKKTKPTGYTHVPTEVATINSAITAATQAKASADEANGYRTAAQTYATNARTSATNASTSEKNANTYKVAAENAKNEILGNGGTYNSPKDNSALKEIRSAKTEIVGTTGTAKSPNDNSALKEIRNTKTEILGETGTYKDPSNNSALKEIRDFTKTGGSLAQAKKAAQDAASSRDAIRSIESNMNTAVEAAGQIDSFRSEITTYHTETKNARNDILSKGADGEKSVYEKIIDAETSIIGSGGTVAEPKEGSALKATKDAQKAAAQSAKEAKEAATSANQGIKVVDALDNTSTSNALSANQGRVLNEKIANLNEIYIMKSGETEADVPKSVEVIIMPEESGTPVTDGKSAYQIALDNGFVGSQSEWLASLKGDKGDKGDAFTYDDFTAEQLAALKGDKGDKGDKGEPGSNGLNGKDGIDGADYILTDSDKYEIADLVGTAVVPDYWMEELEEKADAIQQAMETAGRNKSAFLWYTDSHWVNGNSKISPKLLNYLYMNTPMNKVNFGGDIIGDSLLATRDEMKYLYEWRKAIRNLPNHHSVFGNHDMYDSSSVEYENDNYRYAFLLAPEETADMVCGDGNYYYIDNQSEKTRYLHLAYLSSDLTAMLAQGEFICDSIKSVPEGWHIVAIAHRWWQYTSSSNPTVGVIPEYETEILQIFDEYNARKSHSASNYFTSQNFADAKGKVEFCIGGHLHVDYDFKSDGGIPVIITAPDTNQNRVPDSTVDCGTTGTITESAVFGIIADYNEDVTKITVVGVGRGTSRVVRASTVVPISISDISYNGNTTVGSAIDKSKFSFTVNYSDGTTSSVTGANTVTPEIIGSVGNNSVTITYEEDGTTLTGTVTIVGTEKLVVNLFDQNDSDVLLTGRFNSSHNAVAYAEGQLCTGYIEAKLGDVFDLTSDKSNKTNGYTGVVQMYDSNKTFIGGYNNETVNWTWSSDYLTGRVEVDSSLSSTAYVRFCVAYTDINSIIITKS